MAGELKTSVILELVDKITAPARRVTESLSGISRRGGLDNLRSSARRVQTELGNTLKRTVALGKGLAVMSAAAGGAVFALGRMVSAFTGPADAAIKLSRRLSMTHEQVQLLVGAAGRMSDMGDGQMASNLEAFTTRLAQAAAGMGEPAKAMRWAGIALRDRAGNMRSSLDVMMDIADKMQRIDSEEMRARFARAMFGMGGTGMINVLQEGREGLQREMEAWRRTGQLVSDEDAQAAERYNDNVGELLGTIRGLRNAVAVQLLPTFNKWLETLNPLIQGNREMVGRQVLERLRQLWSGLRAVGNAVAGVADFVGGFGNLVAIVSALLAGKFLISLITTGIELYKVGKVLFLFSAKWIPLLLTGIKSLSLALLTTPIGWIILGITALAGAVYLIYRNWDGIAEWFSGLWSRVKAFFDRGIGDIAKDLLAFHPANLLLKAVDAVFELFGARPLSDLGREWIGGLASGIAERFEQLTGWLRQKVSALTGWLPDWMTGGGLSQSLAAPAGAAAAPKLGPPAFSNRPAPLVAPGRTDVGGELRIKIDQEGRARVASMKANGGLDYSVESGLLGVVQ
ncbi:phage tail tape measure protein [Ectopseudomonas mendocina]|nr:phage tail tape measure protein [Pseudomonas mendocina]